MDTDHAVCDTKRWILSLPTHGALEVDDEAACALANQKGILPSGILKVQGRFMENAVTKIVHRGSEIARGMVSMNSQELDAIRRQCSSDYEDSPGSSACAEACNHGNVIFTT